MVMEDGQQAQRNFSDGYLANPSVLLDLAAADDLKGFKLALDSGDRLAVDGFGLWYGRRIGSRKMGYEERTPLMIAALYGSAAVLRYILAAGKADVNRTAGSDGVSALHLAVAGGSPASATVVEILLDAAANPNSLDSNGNKPADLIPTVPKPPVVKKLQMLLTGEDSDPSSPKTEGFSGAPLPDINTGVYASDEFRMYSFKIKPCSRAYTHDWTECPFAHPGENARRRDPLRHQYSCVPCPEFKKGSCKKGDDCEYAHGVFESWLHPAQYRTRLCKDETGCARKVCFFAHKKEELRPVYASTGSAIPSSDTFTPPMSPSFSPSSPSSPKWGGMSKVNCSTPPPSLQLPGGSRLRSSVSARDVDLGMEIFRLENQIAQQKQLKLMDEMAYGRIGNGGGELKPANLENVFGSVSVMNSPTGLSPMNDAQLRQNLNHLRNSYPNPSRKLSPTELDGSPKSVAAAMLNSRAAAAFAKRSHSFIDRGTPVGGGAGSGGGGYSGVSGGGRLTSWSSGDGRADWSVHGDDLSKLRRSASFGIRGNGNGNSGRPTTGGFNGSVADEPDVSWVSSLVKDVGSPWVDQMYIEQEQMVA